MLKKKYVSRLLTYGLAVGIAIAIYDSVTKQKNLNNSPPVEKTAQTVAEEQLPDQASQVTVGNQIANGLPLGNSLIKPKVEKKRPNIKVVIPNIGGFPEGKITEGSTLHVIGVYEGEPEKGKEKPPWWTNCEGMRDDPEAMKKCHQKYASIRDRHKINITINYTKTPVVLALMAYEPVLWDIDLYSGVKVEGVVMAGYHSQEIIGLPTIIPLLAHTYESSDCDNCKRGNGYFYAYKQDNNLSNVANKLHQITGKNIASFQGAYKARKFNINNNSD